MAEFAETRARFLLFFLWFRIYAHYYRSVIKLQARSYYYRPHLFGDQVINIFHAKVTLVQMKIAVNFCI